MKKLLLFSVFLLTTVLIPLSAQVVAVNSRSGSASNYEMSGVRCIRFANGQMTVVKTDGTTSVYSVAGVSALSFQAVTSGITSAVNPSSFSYQSGCITMNAATASPAFIINTKGQVVRTFDLNEGLNTLSVVTLPPGIYILRAGTTNFKFCR